jgi:transcriptional regulator PpsR
MEIVSIARPDVMLRLDPRGRITHVSLANKLARLDAGALLGRLWVSTVDAHSTRKAERMLEDTAERDVSAFRQVNQCFPGQTSHLVEYTLVRLGEEAGIVAVGRCLDQEAQLQAQFLDAQREVEREAWKIREMESRYRLIFDHSSEALVLVRAANLRVVEANGAALRALELPAECARGDGGHDFLDWVDGQDQERFLAALERTRHGSRAPALLLHLGPRRRPWLVRASLATADTGNLYLLQCDPADGGPASATSPELAFLDGLVHGEGDAFVVVDGTGMVVFANAAATRLTGGSEGKDLVGRLASQWLQPDAPSSADRPLIGPGDWPRAFQASLAPGSGPVLRVDVVTLEAGTGHHHLTGLLLLPHGVTDASA